MKTPPAPETALNDLAPLWPVLYAALEYATQETRAFFDREGDQLNRPLAPDLVRYFVCRFLDAEGHAVEYEREALAKNGLYLKLPGYHVRIRKSDNGDLPAPGPSRTLHAFWQQLRLFDEGGSGEDAHNVFVLWEVIASYKLVGLSLAYPVADDDPTSFQALWTTAIPHPAVSAAAIASSSETAEELEITRRDASHGADEAGQLG